MAKRTGPLTEDEIHFITENREKMMVHEIATSLNRRPATVSDFIVQNFGETGIGKGSATAKTALKKKPYYEDLKRQFTPEELKTFEYHYVNLYNQFQDDVFHTEEGQILDYAKLEILLGRCLARQNRGREEIEDIENQIDHEKQAPPDVRDQDRLMLLMQSLGALNASSQNGLREYNDLMQRKQSLLKEIKGTRDQRIKTLEDTKQTFGTLMAKFAMDANYRRQVGLEMEKFKQAMIKEEKRLSEEILYDDGVYDRPLLNSKTVLMDDNEET